MYTLKLLVVSLVLFVVPAVVLSAEVPVVQDGLGLNLVSSLLLDSPVRDLPLASLLVNDHLLLNQLVAVDLLKLGLLNDVSVALPVAVGLDAVNVLLV